MGVNMELFCQITLNYKGSGSGSNRSILRVFRERKKSNRSPKRGYFTIGRVVLLIGSLEYVVRQYHLIHTCEVMTPSSNPPTHASLKLKTSQEHDNGKKIYNSSGWRMYQKAFFLPRVEAEKKTKGDPHLSFQTTITVA